MSARARFGFLATASMLVACGGRSDEWDAAAGAVNIAELRSAAVVVDSALHRGLVVRANANQELDFARVELGKDIAQVVTSNDRERAFVLSRGVATRLRATDEGPALSVMTAANPTNVVRYPLPDALTSLALDPAGRFAIVYAGDATGTFISNPNELIVVDLAAPPGSGNPSLRNLPSNIGGAPKRLTFTEPLHFPAGDRRLVVVETDRDVMLVDIEHPDRPEISIPVKDPRTDSRALSPAGIAVDPGDATSSPPRAPVLAVRTNSDDNVLIYTLGPSNKEPPENDYTPTPNAAAVGGVPTDIAFVSTNQGLRLAVMVPGATSRGLLVKVDDNQTLTAKFGAAYQRLSPVMGQGAEGGGEALLFSTDGKASSVALWDLTKVPDIAFGDIDTLKSVETLNLSGPVDAVMSPSEGLKVVRTTSRAFYVVDLNAHQIKPLSTTSSVELRYSPAGDRAWAYIPNLSDLARIDLSGPHVLPVVIDRPMSGVVEIERADGGKSLLALHASGTFRSTSAPSGSGGSGGSGSTMSSGGTLGITVFDALAPDAATSRRYSSVLLEEIAQ